MSAYYLDRAEVAAILWSVIRSEPTEPAPLHYQPSWRIMLPRLAVILISLSIVTVVLMWQFSAATSFPSAAVATLLLIGLLATVLHFSTPRYWRRPPAVVLDDMWYAQLLARYLRGPQ